MLYVFVAHCSLLNAAKPYYRIYPANPANSNYDQGRIKTSLDL